jgi:hypothetical protein
VSPKLVLETVARPYQKNNMRIRLVILTLILALVPVAAISAELKVMLDHVDTGEKPFYKKCQINITGIFEKGDADQFERLLKLIKQRRQTVEFANLNSDGGDVNEAMRIGRMIRQNVIRTQVFSGDFCRSACFFVWASGAERLTSDSSIGVHRPRFKKEYFKGLSANEAEHKYLEMANLVRDYLEDMNIPNQVIENMFNQSSNNILYLNSSTLKKLRKIPFFDEWIIANCGAFTVEEEDKIYELWQKEFYEGNLLKEEKFYLSKLQKKRKDHYQCQNRLLYDSQKKVK